LIKIIDNFFKDKDLEMVQDFALNKAIYVPQFFSPDQEKTKQNHYGNRFMLENNENLLNLFKKQTEINFNIKILKLGHTSGIDQRNLDHFKPHIDSNCIINILIMIYGPIAVTNGTVFYTNSELDIHVGFRPNRAIMFPSNRLHSPHASNNKKLLRYTSTLFIQEYEKI
jgi:hypothetical protein